MSVPGSTLPYGLKEAYISHFIEQDGQELWEELPRTEGEERAEILLQLAQEAIYASQGSKALALAEEAYEIYKKLGVMASSIDVANSFSLIGHSLFGLGKLDGALWAMDQSIEVLRDCHFPFVGDALRTKASWLVDANKYEEALEVYLEIANLHEVEGDSQFLAFALTSIAFCFLNLGQWEEAITHSQRAREIAKSEKRVDIVAWADIYMAEAFLELGTTDIALDVAQRVLDIANLRDMSQLRCRSLLILGRGSVSKSDFTAAEGRFTSAKNLAQSSTDWETIKKIEKEFINLYLVQGRTDEAAEVERQLKSLEEIV